MKDFIDQMVPLFNNLSNDLNKITPPSDVKDWHTNLVTELNDAADIMSQMSTALDKPLDEAMSDITDLSTQMNDMQDPFDLTALPDEYQTAFQENSDCHGPVGPKHIPIVRRLSRGPGDTRPSGAGFECCRPKSFRA